MTDHHQPEPLAPDDATSATFAVPSRARSFVFRAPAALDGSLSPQLARLILDRYTIIGDVVIDVDDDTAFATTAVQAGRHHHALGGAERMATIGHAAGYIDLMLVHWPRPAINPHWLLLACHALLRNAGCLVIAVTVEPGQRLAHLNALTGAAGTAGLRTVGRIAVADPDDGVATRVAAPSSPTRRAHRRRRPDAPAVSRSAHTDLLVFKTQAGPR